MKILKKHLKSKSLSFKMWFYLAGFALLIMAFLWIFQIFLLNTFYENMKMNQIVKIGKTLVKEYGNEDFEENIYNISFKNGIVAQVVDSSGRPVMHSDSFGDFRSPRTNPKEFRRFLSEMNKESDKMVAYRSDFMGGMHTVVFGAELDTDGDEKQYLYINAPLAPVGATQQVLQTILLIVTVLSLIMSVALSYFIARKFSKPLAKMSDSALKLAEGDYNVAFNESGYTEIERLSSALNYMTSELSKTDELRRDLIANVSHDLKTPLTIIKSYAEMIRDLSGDKPEKRRQHTQVIVDEADRLNLLVSDLLDLSKLEAKTVELNFKEFDIYNTVNSILQGFKVLEEQDGYEFEVHAEPNGFVYADEHRMQQVIYNLLSNAVNYTGADKKITVYLSKAKGKVRFSVKDTGTGISQEEQERVWERYYKSGKGHRRADRGTGIGLSIVKNVLLAHNAEFGINSQSGLGSEFWFELDEYKNI